MLHLYVPLSEDEERTAVAGLARLTATEQEVLEGMLQALSSKRIARLRGSSPRTVEVHKRNIMTKLGVKSSKEVYRICIALSNRGHIWSHPEPRSA